MYFWFCCLYKWFIFLYKWSEIMLDYELIYEKKQHYLTIPQDNNRKLCFGNSSIIKAIKHQKEGTDLFITKYAEDNIVSCIILDFDDKANPDNALKDAKKLKMVLNRQGLNTVIVKSGSKGYHCYIQIPILNFGNDDHVADVDSEAWFKKFTELIIQGNNHVQYATLDTTNTGAGLRGNIRVIGSIHPKTNNRCEIIDGEFKELVVPNQFVWDCFNDAHEFARIHEKHEILKERQRKANVKKYNGMDDPIAANDLRTLMPSIYGGDYKTFKNGYIMMQCPFHNDSNPSMIVKKEFYYCKACGEKGNWWNLRDKGVVDFEDYIRVGENNGQ